MCTCVTKRTPLDTNYYETFNKDSVLLVDADTDGPVEEITEKGVRAGGKEYEFDIIVFATGFDAFTGSLKALNIKGCGGRALNDAWADGPRTYLAAQGHAKRADHAACRDLRHTLSREMGGDTDRELPPLCRRTTAA